VTNYILLFGFRIYWDTVIKKRDSRQPKSKNLTKKNEEGRAKIERTMEYNS